jgi:hypothetical protein
VLSVSLHAGRLAAASFGNRLGWMEVAYASKPAPLSDYKAAMTTVDEGAFPPADLRRYPRYAASVWDLVARAVAICRTPSGKVAEERLWPVEPAGSFVPYATALCAIVEIQAGGPRGKKRLLATCEITRLPGARGRYEAAFMEDCFDDITIDPFVHRPQRLDHWQLLQAALAWRLAGEEALPPRPFIFQPDPVKTEEGIKVRLAALTSRWTACTSPDATQRASAVSRNSPSLPQLAEGTARARRGRCRTCCSPMHTRSRSRRERARPQAAQRMAPMARCSIPAAAS